MREQASISERAAGGARQWMAMIERESETLLLFTEFWAYGVRDAGCVPHVAACFAETRSLLTGLIAEGARDFDLELTIPAEHLAIVIDALADGIARQKLADPDAVPDELMGERARASALGGDAPGSAAQRRVVDGERPPRERTAPAASSPARTAHFAPAAARCARPSAKKRCTSSGSASWSSATTVSPASAAIAHAASSRRQPLEVADLLGLRTLGRAAR